jgi:hypothetical protein
MGTRSLIDFIDAGKVITTVYRQFDGYPTGRGQELADFLKPLTMVNGIRDSHNVANGMGCLAAQWIAHEKDGAGGVYIHAPGTRDVWEDFVYTVEGSVDDGITMTCRYKHGDKELFRGRPADFDGERVETTDDEQSAESSSPSTSNQE